MVFNNWLIRQEIAKYLSPADRIAFALATRTPLVAPRGPPAFKKRFARAAYSKYVSKHRYSARRMFGNKRKRWNRIYSKFK